MDGLISTAMAREEFRKRSQIAIWVVLALFAILFLRFAWLQLVEHDRYSALSESNHVSLVPNIPPRGVLYDRHGVALASGDWGYALEVVPEKIPDLSALWTQLGEVVRIEEADLRRFRRLRADSRPFEAVPIRRRLSEEEVARFAAQRYRFPGVELRTRDWRSYPFGETFSHLIGYIGRISQKDKQALQEAGRWSAYRGAQYIGKAGVEKRYEDWLHGQTGFDHVEVDSSGRAVRSLGQTPAVAGSNLTLHVDAGLQQVAEAAFGPYRGALVALDPRNGGLLALLSKPGYDPNLFVDGIDVETWRGLNESLDKPLINRALRGVYPPGSTIKPFMALAGLELGLRRPSDSIADPGYFSLSAGGHRYRDWKKDGHGTVDMHKSVVVSCDTYYYRLAHEMGIERMHDFLSQFGLGQRSGVDLDGELAGLMPNTAWKKKRFKQPWWPGETVIAGIGQGYVLTTPMQLAVATMAIANDGVVYKPQIVRAWRNPKDGRSHTAAPEVVRSLNFKPEHLQLVKAAMQAVTQPGGTAAGAGAGASYTFAGKTGTAQVVSMSASGRSVSGSARHRDNALFIAFAPVDKPTIALAVMVENGGHGGSTAAPIARKVLDYWFLGQTTPGAAVMPAPGSAPEATSATEDVGHAD